MFPKTFLLLVLAATLVTGMSSCVSYQDYDHDRGRGRHHHHRGGHDRDHDHDHGHKRNRGNNYWR